MKTTISIIKADTGSIGGHNKPSIAMLAKATEQVEKAVKKGRKPEAGSRTLFSWI